MHVAFVSPFDAHAGRGWSGIPTHMQRALGAHVGRVSVVDTLAVPRTLRDAARAARARLAGGRFMRYHTLEAADALAEQASAAVHRLRPDAVLGPSSLPFARLEADVPVAFWTDLTFESALFLYDGYGSLGARNVAEGHRVDAEALGRAHAFYASDYAARSATGYYGAERVSVVPFGANLDAVPAEADVHDAIDARPSDRCQLLFLGVDWVRKGGDIAVRVADHMNAAGLPTRLVVVGCAPQLDRPRPYVEARGFVSKATPAGRAEMEALLSTSHALVLPARAEAFGCVFCEASAYGLPSVATACGGSGSAVVDGDNGFLFGLRPTPGEIADRLLALVRDRDAYRALARRARAAYDERLNWHAATGAVVRRLEAL